MSIRITRYLVCDSSYIIIHDVVQQCLQMQIPKMSRLKIVSVFQNISTENLVSRVSEFIPMLEEIKIGKVSLTLIM